MAEIGVVFRELSVTRHGRTKSGPQY